MTDKQKREQTFELLVEALAYVSDLKNILEQIEEMDFKDLMIENFESKTQTLSDLEAEIDDSLTNIEINL